MVATDGDGDTLTYALTGSVAFTIDAAGRIAVASGAVLDYETQTSHTVTVTAADPDGASDSIAVTIAVVNVNEPGVVRLSTDTPEAGSALIATVSDPDGILLGSVAWQWKRSPDGTTAANVNRTDFPNIAGATEQSFLLTDADAGRWLRALAIYSDPFGAGQRARAQTANPARAPAAAPTITGGPILNSPAYGGVYGAGEPIIVQLTFSKPVTVSGQPRLGLVIGDAARWAAYDRSSQDGATLQFAYAVQAGDRDDDGLSVTANSLELNGGSVTGANGVAADLAHPGADLPTHTVNAARAQGGQPQTGPTSQTVPPVAARDDRDAPVGDPFRRPQLALGLLRVARDEGRGGIEDAAREAERPPERALAHVAEVTPAVTHERDVGAREAVDRLPVVADEEVGDAGAVQRLQQRHAPCGDVLELVDQHVAVG